MCVREYDLEVPYGVIEADSERVTSVVEKPIHRFFVNAGIYVLEQLIFDEFEIGSRLEMTDLLQSHISKGARVCMFPIHEYWLDIGRIPEYERAQKDATERLSKN